MQSGYFLGGPLGLLNTNEPALKLNLNVPNNKLIKPNLIRLIAKGYAQLVLDVSVDVLDVSEV